MVQKADDWLIIIQLAGSLLCLRFFLQLDLNLMCCCILS